MATQTPTVQLDPRLRGKVLHYDRDEVVSELLSFYKFLPHVHPSSIQEAPPGGWEMITAENLARHNIHKSDEALDLLRHLPYLDNPMPWIRQCAFTLDYRILCEIEDPKSRDKAGWHYNLADDWVPSWVVELTAGTDVMGRRYMLDTTDGTVSSVNYDSCGDGPLYAEEDPRIWREHMSYPETETLKDLLDRMRSDYREMLTLGIPWPKDDDGLWNNRETLYDWWPEYKAVRIIYVHYGWPNNYQKEACIQALRFWYKEWLKRRDPAVEGKDHPWLTPEVFMEPVTKAVEEAGTE